MMLACAPARAATGDFVRCDGYPAPVPGRGFDGINLVNWTNGHDLNGRSTGTNLFEMNGLDADRAVPVPSREGEFLCGAALADPLLTGQFWVRRAYLMQMQAIHQIAAGHGEAALVTLDAVAALGNAHADGWFPESIRIADVAIRVAALQRLGRIDAARALLTQLDGARAFAPSVATLARRLHTLVDADPGAAIARMIADAPLAPDLLEELFWRAFYSRDYPRALTLAHEIPYVSIDTHTGWSLDASDSYSGGIGDRMRVISLTAAAVRKAIDGGTVARGAPGAPAAEPDKFDLAELMRLLLRPEAAALAPKFVAAGRNVRTLNGFDYGLRNADGLIAVSFGSLRASPAMAEEAVLLAAALEARRKGMDSLLIESREMRRRSTASSTDLNVGSNNWRAPVCGGIGGDGWSSGYEAVIAVRMLSSAALPADVEASRWRLVAADKVIAALGPKYPAPRAAR